MSLMVEWLWVWRMFPLPVPLLSLNLCSSPRNFGFDLLWEVSWLKLIVQQQEHVGNIQARGGACRAAGGRTWCIHSAVERSVLLFTAHPHQCRPSSPEALEPPCVSKLTSLSSTCTWESQLQLSESAPASWRVKLNCGSVKKTQRLLKTRVCL